MGAPVPQRRLPERTLSSPYKLGVSRVLVLLGLSLVLVNLFSSNLSYYFGGLLDSSNGNPSSDLNELLDSADGNRRQDPSKARNLKDLSTEDPNKIIETPSPTATPTNTPSSTPTPSPTPKETPNPTPNPTSSPSREPTGSPSSHPTDSPTLKETPSPTPNPTNKPSMNPTALKSINKIPEKSLPADEPTDKQRTDGPKFAYLYTIAGCTETSCLSYVLNAVVAAEVLQKHNSTADIILLVRMSSRIPDDKAKLHATQEDYLQKAGIIVHYIPKLSQDNFGTATLEKFRALELLQYDRVLFLDSDTVPRCNLDYMFHESFNEDGVLSGFVGKAGNVEPVTAAFFLVTPTAGEFGRLMDMVQSTIQQSNGGFDPYFGWGHNLTKNDAWRALWKGFKGRDGTKWNFKAAHSDQGIILMYFKYVLMNYTQLFNNEVETWQEITGNESYWEAQDGVKMHFVDETNKTIAKVKHTKDQLIGCNGKKDGPYSDIFHYSGGQKPWNVATERGAPNIFNVSIHIPNNQDSKKTFWPYHLGQANETFHLQLPSAIDFDKGGNPLGYGDKGSDLFNYRKREGVQGADVPLPLLENVTLALGVHNPDAKATLAETNKRNKKPLEPPTKKAPDLHLLELTAATTNSIATSARSSPNEASSTVTSKNGKFAYLYTIAGCTETSCLSYILNAVVAAEVLQRHNSTADIILLVRMSSRIPDDKAKLHATQEDYLQKAGIIVHYIPKLSQDNFGTATLEKFRALELLQYDRVLFLDSDTVPRCNLDYMFHESYNEDGVLSGFVGKAGNVEPVTAAFFLVTPTAGEFGRLMDMVQSTIRQSNGGFDPYFGWGHNLTKNDAWRALWKGFKGRDGTKWNFKAAHSDQGIILMYFKYVLMNYTQLFNNEVETWQDITGNELYWEAQDDVKIHFVDETNKTIAKVKHTKDQLIGCNGKKDGPYSDIFHYSGGQKPWNVATEKGAPNVFNVSIHIPNNPDNKKTFWPYHLGQANETFHLQLPSAIDFDMGGNPLGYGDKGSDLFNYRKREGVQGADVPLPLLENVTLALGVHNPDAKATLAETNKRNKKPLEPPTKKAPDLHPLELTAATTNSIATSARSSPNEASSAVTSKNGKFAYLYTIAGCTETSCLSYILNAVVAAEVLQRHNSTADIILLVRMSSRIPDDKAKLHATQEDYLQKAGIIVHYIPKLSQDNFGTATLEKFRALELLQYDRVLFLDSDTVPRCNLDYMFHESYNEDGVLSGFVGKAGNVEPVTAAFFLVTPTAGEFGRLMDMVQSTIRQSNGGFDPYFGWGHNLTKNDAWRAVWKGFKGRDGTKWDFKAAHSDQGIILMYFKYVLMNYTQLFNNEVETWQDITGNESYWEAQDDVKIHFVDETNKTIAKVKHTKDQLIGCNGKKDGPYSDIFHYSGGQKPWNVATEKGAPNVFNVSIHIPSNPDNKKTFWPYHLGQANETFHLQLPSAIDFDKGGNPLGYGDKGSDLFNYRKREGVQGADVPLPHLENVILGGDDDAAVISAAS